MIMNYIGEILSWMEALGTLEFIPKTQILVQINQIGFHITTTISYTDLKTSKIDK